MRLEEHGTDFLEFYRELVVSAADPRLRHDALVAGRRFCQRMISRLERRERLLEPMDVVDGATVVSIAAELGLAPRARALRALTVTSLEKLRGAAMGPVTVGRAARSADDLCENLISYHFACRSGLVDPAPLLWSLELASVYEYQDPRELSVDQLVDQDNLLTHVVYVMSDYGRLRLPSERFKVERAALLKLLERARLEVDFEGVAEALDALLIVGVPDDAPELARGRSWLLSEQQDDGSWSLRGFDFYDRYHSTWTALNGLRRFRFRGRGLAWPRWRP